MATKQPMMLSQFQDLVDRLGAEPEQWPAAERADATALLASSQPARQILDEARALKAALTGPAIAAPAGLSHRILEAALGAKPAAKAERHRS